MPRVLQFSDPHIHPHGHSKFGDKRLYDCLAALEWSLRTAYEHGVDEIICLGDLFHDRQKIHIPAYHMAYQLFKKYDSIPIKVLLGNHDMFYTDRWSVNSIAPLDAMRHVTVVAEPQTLDVCGVPVDFLPYTSNPIETTEKYFPKRSKVLCGHVSVDGAVLHKVYNVTAEVHVESENGVVAVRPDIFRGWDRVFLGHFHCAQIIADFIEYVGSPLELSFGERDQTKHLVILDLETMERRYIKNDFSPKHLVLDDDTIGKADIGNNIVKVEVLSKDQHEILALRQELERKKPQGLEIKKKVVTNLQEYCERLQGKFDIASGDILDRFLESMETNLNKKTLSAIGHEIVYENQEA